MVPLSLSVKDFDAYAPERTRATTMTAPRSAVKKRLLEWMQELSERLAAEGIDRSQVDPVYAGGKVANNIRRRPA